MSNRPESFRNVPIIGVPIPAEIIPATVSLLRARRRIDLQACARCGLTDPLALQRFDNSTCCRRCARVARSLPATECDHVIGRRNSAVTLTIDANDHARLTALQSLWPNATQRNPYHDPLLASAALLHRIADLATVDDVPIIGEPIIGDALTRRYVVALHPETQRLALRLERASAYLQRAFGHRWHTHADDRHRR